MSCLGRSALRARGLFGIGTLLALLALGAGPAYASTSTTHSFVSSFDGSDSTAGAFGGLSRVAVSDTNGNIYALDPGHGVLDKFDSSGVSQPFSTLELPAGSTGLNGSNTPDGSFSLGGEDDVAVDNSGAASDGNIYVDSEFAGAVYAFDKSGGYLYKLTGFGDTCGVAVDPAGNVWVADYSAAAVSEYTAAGTPTGTSVDVSAYGNPCHIAFDSNGNLYVDMYQGVVEKFDASGHHVAQTDPGPAYAVAVDRSTNHVYVDNGATVAEYDASGHALGTFGTAVISNASGVAVNSSTGNGASGDAIVSDSGASKVHIFGPDRLLTIPDTTTGLASNLTGTTARLGGAVNPSGVAATCSFDYGTTSAYGSAAPCMSSPGSGTSYVAVHADISGLTPGTTYHFRLNGTSADGTASGTDQTFTTPLAPAVGDESTTVGSTSATLKAIVNAGAAATTYHFEYGTDTSYGSSTPVPDGSAGSGSSGRSVSVDVSGLQPSTTYHFRIVASNAAGTTNGGDHTFTTRAGVAVDTCPNAVIRQQQGSNVLPDCRAWELVSQADKGLNSVRTASMLAAAGDHVMYDTYGGVPGSSSGSRPKLQATRTASGWISRSMLPPAPQLLAQTYLFNAVSSDLSGYVASAFDGVGQTDLSPNVTLAYIDANGNQTVLHRFPQYFGSGGVDLAASSDLRHVFASVPEAIAPSHQPGTWDLYDFGSGTPKLVGTMPGTDAAPTCGLPIPASFTQTGFVFGAAIDAEHWTSTDGSRVFFQSQGDDAPACTAPLELYTHDMGTGRSTLLSGPPVSGDPNNGVDRFLQATPDGSVAFFRTATSLVPADDADGNSSDMDVYRWTASNGQLDCITCGLPQAQVLDPTLVSQDGSHVYFSSVRQFDGAPAGATSSRPNTYVWRNGSIHFIAQTDGVNDRTVNLNTPSQATPDGNVLLFAGDTADLNARSRSDNGGKLQYYRYDDTTQSITCVSCPSDGSAATVAATTPLTTGFTSNQKYLRAISDDGSTIVFGTAAALVPQDTDNGPDLYEWRNGTVGLVSSGTATRTNPQLVTLSPSGRDVLFMDSASLTADAQDGAIKLYDARVDGGFSPLIGQAPACAGDQCRGPLSGPPSLPDPASASTAGPGNATPASAARFSFTAITAALRSRLARTGRLDMRVRVSKAGVVSAIGLVTLGGHARTVLSASVRARAAGIVTLHLRLSSAARRRLAFGGMLRVSLTIRFSGARARHVTLVLRPRGGSAARRAAAAAVVPATAKGR